MENTFDGLPPPPSAAPYRVPVGVDCNDAIGDEFERPCVTEKNLGVEVAGVPLAAGLDGLEGMVHGVLPLRVWLVAVPSDERGGVMGFSSTSSYCWLGLVGFSELGERLRSTGRTEFALRIGSGNAAPLV